MSDGEKIVSFAELGLLPVLCETCQRVGYSAPTKIQCQTIPYAIKGRDILGIAETGSGKTAAFALPVLQDLLRKSIPFHTLVIAPTRELALQISEQFKALGSIIGLRAVNLVGGCSTTAQAVELAKKPHVVVGTPGRILYHLEKTKSFNLRNLRYLVLDEADMLLTTDFEVDLDKIILATPTERRTFLFSATMTEKVDKLQRMSLKDPVRLEISKKFQTVKTLKQHYIFVPYKHKDCYFVYLMNELVANCIIVFAGSKKTVKRLHFILTSLGFKVGALHGDMQQSDRLQTFARFRSKAINILVSTNVASRGLDISHIDTIINYDLSRNPKDYIHRVGRTARAGAAGCSISIVTQYDIEVFQRVENAIQQKMELYQTDEELVLTLLDRVAEAQRLAMLDLKADEKEKDHDDNDDDNNDADNDDDDDDDGDGNNHRAHQKKKKAKFQGKRKESFAKQKAHKPNKQRRFK